MKKTTTNGMKFIGNLESGVLDYPEEKVKESLYKAQDGKFYIHYALSPCLALDVGHLEEIEGPFNAGSPELIEWVSCHLSPESIVQRML
ncbi:MAG: hypothetical protein JW920_07685 [Deltaproteobacteria bacterium]|nr:hypothetical protein [Deltaproteobacteria bacterium]